MKEKILVLIGPTASGKSELAVKLAKKYSGEIISADSRQIYKGLDLGTGKIEGKWILYKMRTYANHTERRRLFCYKGVPHYCIDYINPTRQYSSANFQRDAKKAIKDILKRGKLPIICGGSAHWVDAVVYDQQLPGVKPNKKLRAELEKKSVGQLFQQLQKLDPERAKTIDAKNPHRLIRALEIVMTTGKPVPKLEPQNVGQARGLLWIGIKTNQVDQYKKIDKRLKDRFNEGMIEEVKKLKKSGLSWKRLEEFGLEYKFIAQYLQEKITYEQMLEQLSFAIKHYSKRQLTWWKRNKEIKWVASKPTDTKLIAKLLK